MARPAAHRAQEAEKANADVGREQPVKTPRRNQSQGDDDAPEGGMQSNEKGSASSVR